MNLPKKGISSLVCFLETSSAKYVLIVPLSLTDGNGEARFLRNWERIGVNVPHVLEDGQLGEHPYLIMEYINAPTLQDLVRDNKITDDTWKDIGRTLACMHTPKTNGFGRISVEGKPEYQHFDDWLLGPDIEQRISTVRSFGLLGDEHGRIDKVFGTLLAYAEEKEFSTLCHFDLSPNNILATNPLTVFDPSPMLNYGIIDVGRCMLSPLFHDQPLAAEAIKNGYFDSGVEYSASALQASIILNAYWRFVYQQKIGRVKEMEVVRKYLVETSYLLE